MIELALLLLAMGGNQATDVRADQPTRVSRQTETRKASTQLSDKEKDELREALARIVRCSTGKLRYDPVSRFYVPEMRPGCK